MRNNKKKYPGIQEVEAERKASAERNTPEEEPDFINGVPNYDKFTGMSPEEIMVWLNID